MHLSANEAYLETQITTATPQRLRLMLIEAGLRRARASHAAGQAGRTAESTLAIRQCRDIVTELIAGIRPDQTPEAKRVLAIHLFLFSTLVEIEFARDPHRLNDVIRVLEQERQTWQAICEQMPDRQVAPAPAEETAPQRVADGWAPGYRPAAGNNPNNDPAAPFSIEA
jgi:flagellar protein FliS